MSDTTDKLLKAEELEGAGADPFAEPIGPTPDCFSSNDVVRMFRLGALQRDVDHIRSCAVCRERVEAFSRVLGKPLEAAPARSSSRTAGERIRRRPVPSAAGAHALVHVPSEYAVSGSAVVEPVRVQLVAGPVSNLRNVKVRLNGALSAEVADWSSGGEEFPVLEVRNVKPSQEVLQGLKRHKRVTGRIVVQVGDSTGTADVVFRRSG
jgi:hypothetical protein